MIRRRWRSRPTGKARLKRNLLIILVILLLFLIQGYVYVDTHLKGPLMSLAKVRIKQMATEAINSAISERVSETTNFEKLIDWRSDKNGKVTGFSLNYGEHMKITSETVRTVEQKLKALESVPEHIPLGQAMSSPILASFGPDIPIKLTPAGAAKVELNTRYQNAGINMILVEVYIRITVELTIIIPFDTVPEVVQTELPISYSLVVGDVPTYYFDGKGNPVGQSNPLPPGISLPNLSLTAPTGKEAK
ncbi:sporulation protein YunB [Paenibacillus silviterrae]|uniref:sporulation protein YunB n=1 Tax=Paenibacillus silviterrae TaxID=3242194 RepID=UPI002542E083|nr:sporulation protein YunB [Paenibacillus chinjuensis]